MTRATPDRGVTPVVGLILLIGITAIAAAAVFVVGVGIYQGTVDEVDRSQATASFEELAADLDDLRRQSQPAEISFDIAGSEQGAVQTIDGGTVTIRHTPETGEETVLLDNQSLGGLYYSDRTTELVYQSGGIWDVTGDAPVLIRPPTLQYRALPSGTLMLSLITTEPGFTASTPTSGTARVTEQTTVHPSPERVNPLENGTVELVLSSDYCRGWESYLDTRTAGAVTQSCSEEEPDTVVAEFTVPFVFDGAGFDWTGGETEGVITDSDASSATWLVSYKANQCEEIRSEDELSDPIDEEDFHCVDELTEGLTVDTGAVGGDVSLYIRDGMQLAGGNDLSVRGPHNLTIYSDDDISIQGNTVVGNSSDPTQTRIFLSEEASVSDEGGNPEIYALLYAPDSTVSLSGAVTFEGAIVADSFEPDGDVEVTYSETIETVQIVDSGGGPPFYYLHIDQTRIALES